MLQRFAQLSGCSVDILLTTPTSPEARLALAVEAERIFMRWAIYLVLHRKTVQPHSAYQYIKNVRSSINDHTGFDMLSVHKMRNLNNLITGLLVLRPHVKRRRDPILQQHILAWAAVLDHRLHSHRMFLALVVVLFSTVSRFGDLNADFAEDFSSNTHVTLADVQLEHPCGFITVKCTKMERVCT
jgi:hypothetical protein